MATEEAKVVEQDTEMREENAPLAEEEARVDVDGIAEVASADVTNDGKIESEVAPAADEDMPSAEAAPEVDVQPAVEELPAQDAAAEVGVPPAVEEAPAADVDMAESVPVSEGQEESAPGDKPRQEEAQVDGADAASPEVTTQIAESADKSGAVPVPQNVVAVQIPAAALAQPNKPKKAVTAFWIFSQKAREQLCQEEEAKTGVKPKFGESAKLVSAKWASLTDADRREWDEKAAADRQRYDTEMRAYMEGCDPAGALKARYQHLIPKKPPSSYAMFSSDAVQRKRAADALKEKGLDTNTKNLNTKLGEMWKVASVEEKAPFQEAQLQQHLEYLEKQKTWQGRPEFLEVEKAEKTQAELKKAIEAAKAAEDAARAEREAKERKAASRKRKTDGSKDVTPAKKGRSGAPAFTPPSQKSKATKDPGMQLDDKIVKEASKLGLESGLRNLAARPEVLASGKSAKAILGALQTSGGLVNKAKQALLGR